MSFDLKAIEKAIHIWAQGASPDSVKDTSIGWADTNKDQPAYPFITLKKSGFPDSLNADEIRTVDDGDGGRKIQSRTHDEFTLTIRTHVEDRELDDNSDHAFSMLTNIVGALNLPTAREELCAAGLVVVSRTPVLDISSTTNNKWVSRATVDIRFRIAVIHEEPVDFFDSVAIDGELGDKQQSFTVP